MATTTKEKLYDHCIRLKNRIEASEKTIKQLMDRGEDNRDTFDDIEDDLLDKIEDTEDIYDDIKDDGEYVSPVISIGEDTTHKGRCCVATQDLLDEYKNYVSEAKRLSGSQNKRRETNKLNVKTGGFLHCKFTAFFNAITTVKKTLGDIMDYIDSGKSTEEINTKVRKYNNEDTQALHTAKEQALSEYTDALTSFWLHVVDNHGAVNTTVGKHPSCHKNTWAVSFNDYNASNWIDTKISVAYDNMTLRNKDVPSPKNAKNFTFMSWKDALYNPFDPKTAKITGDMNIYGHWKIGTTLEFRNNGKRILDDVNEKLGDFEQGYDCAPDISSKISSLSGTYSHLYVFPDPSVYFNDTFVDRDNHEFVMDCETKTFTVKAQQRTKKANGEWGEWKDVPLSEQQVKWHNKYYNLPGTKYNAALFGDFYVDDEELIKLSDGSPSSGDADKIEHDTVFKFDVTPLYSVTYLDEKDETVKEKKRIPIGSTFDVDKYAPAAWPKKSFVGDDNDLYSLISGNEYTYKGETITIDGNKTIIPHYESITNGTVIFSLTEKEEDCEWKGQKHIYSDQPSGTSFSEYTEINFPLYPTVQEVEDKKPSNTTDYSNYAWKEDDYLGWYLGEAKITTGSSLKVTPGNNILKFKGHKTSQLTVFCFSSEDKDTLTANGGTWTSRTIDGNEYDGYISHVYDENPEFPAEQHFGDYYTIWGDTVNKYQKNTCRLSAMYDGGYIIPRIASTNTSAVRIDYDPNTCIFDYQRIDGKVATTDINEKISRYFPSNKYIVLVYTTDPNETITFDKGAISVDDVCTIDGKKYGVANLNEKQFKPNESPLVRELKYNATGAFSGYPTFAVESRFGEYDYPGGHYLDHEHAYELIVTSNSQPIESGNWGRGQIVSPISIT